MTQALMLDTALCAGTTANTQTHTPWCHWPHKADFPPMCDHALLEPECEPECISYCIY